MSPTTNVAAERRTAIMAMAGCGGLAAATSQTPTGLFPILAVHYAQLRADQAGLILTGSALVLLVGGPTFGWVADRRGRSAVRRRRRQGGVPAHLGGDDDRQPGPPPLAFGGRRHGHRLPVGEAVGPRLASWIWDVFGVGPMLVARVALAGLTEVYGWWALRSSRRRRCLDRSARPLRVRRPCEARTSAA